MIGHKVRPDEELHSIILEVMIERKGGKEKLRTCYINQVPRVNSYKGLKDKA